MKRWFAGRVVSRSPGRRNYLSSLRVANYYRTSSTDQDDKKNVARGERESCRRYTRDVYVYFDIRINYNPAKSINNYL